MSPSRWYKVASRIIAEAIGAGTAAGETIEQIRARCDAAYPFGERKYWPYKQWLQARRDRFLERQLCTPAEKARYAALPKKRKRPGQRKQVTAYDFDLARADGLIR